MGVFATAGRFRREVFVLSTTLVMRKTAVLVSVAFSVCCIYVSVASYKYIVLRVPIAAMLVCLDGHIEKDGVQSYSSTFRTIGLDPSCIIRQTATSLDQRYSSAYVVISFNCDTSSFNTLFFSVMQYFFIFSGFLYSYTIYIAYGSRLVFDTQTVLM